jgi:hypothetical protein
VRAEGGVRVGRIDHDSSRRAIPETGISIQSGR